MAHQNGVAQGDNGTGFVIVYASGDNALVLGEVNTDGAFAPVQTLDLPEVVGANGLAPMVVSPDGGGLHVVFRGAETSVLSFSIDRDARALAYLGQAGLPASMCNVSTDRDGRFLFGASYGGNCVSVSAIDADGRVGALIQRVETALNPHCCAVSPDNQTLFVPCLGGDLIAKYRIDPASGRLEHVGDVALDKGQGPRHLVFSPDARFGYLLNELEGSIDVLAVQGDDLVPMQTISMMGDAPGVTPWGSDIHISPDGQFVYGAERNASIVVAYRVGSDGRLERIGQQKSADCPRSFTLDPTGRFALVLGQKSGTMTVHQVGGSDGIGAGVEYPIGQTPSWVVVV